MFLKQNLQNTESEMDRSVAPAEKIVAGEPQAAATKPQVAVFVTHGMGQQIPFETLDNTAKGIICAAMRMGVQEPEIRARTVQIEGVKTQRAEFEIKDKDGKDIEVHVYEAYWSPITEGQVTIRDVIGFLFRAGINGLRNCTSSFKRWIFGKPVDFGKRPGALIPLLAALGVVVSLVILNLLIAAVAGEKFLQVKPADLPAIDERLSALTNIAGIFVVATFVFGGALMMLGLRKWTKHPSKSKVWRFATAFVQVLFWLWIVVTVACGVVLVPTRLGWVDPARFSSGVLSDYWMWIWGGLLVASWVVRNLLVRYLGDVAAYVSSHTLDRFNDIRSRVRKTVFDMLKLLYVCKKYDRILIMGHSLGSVVSYDALNALLNEDTLNNGAMNVVDRTKLLLTFGSPLDKTAFIFASQWADITATREALVATLQPLISDYIPCRNIPWVNVHTPRDIVCNDLKFYDDKDHADFAMRGVRNVEDKDALIPLLAHVQYWDNPTVFDELYSRL